jgi:hypothetical protein
MNIPMLIDRPEKPLDEHDDLFARELADTVVRCGEPAWIEIAHIADGTILYAKISSP